MVSYWPERQPRVDSAQPWTEKWWRPPLVSYCLMRTVKQRVLPPAKVEIYFLKYLLRTMYFSSVKWLTFFAVSSLGINVRFSSCRWCHLKTAVSDVPRISGRTPTPVTLTQKSWNSLSISPIAYGFPLGHWLRRAVICCRSKIVLWKLLHVF